MTNRYNIGIDKRPNIKQISLLKIDTDHLIGFVVFILFANYPVERQYNFLLFDFISWALFQLIYSYNVFPAKAISRLKMIGK